jgi:hypothetical protein
MADLSHFSWYNFFAKIVELLSVKIAKLYLPWLLGGGDNT